MSYTEPTAIEVMQILKALELTGGAAANQVCQKNSRTMRKYTSEKDVLNMPYSVLFTLIAKNEGIFITADNWRAELDSANILLHQKPDYKHD